MATQGEHPGVLLLPRQRPALQEETSHKSFPTKQGGSWGPVWHSHTSHVPILVMSSQVEVAACGEHAMGSGCCFVAGFLVPPNPFCGAGGVGGALPVLGPVQPAPVTNTSWFSACLPGAGASLGIADSPQHLPLVPPQLPDEYFPFSHSFNCPTWRKLLRTGSGLLRTAGHPRSGGVGDGMGGLPITAACTGALGASSRAGTCRHGGARARSRVFWQPRSLHPSMAAGGRPAAVHGRWLLPG